MFETLWIVTFNSKASNLVLLLVADYIGDTLQSELNGHITESPGLGTS